MTRPLVCAIVAPAIVLAACATSTEEAPPGLAGSGQTYVPNGSMLASPSTVSAGHAASTIITPPSGAAIPR